MTASGRTPVGGPQSDPTRDSELGLPRTYGRTDGDELVKRDTEALVSNARGPKKNPLIGLWSKRNTETVGVPLTRYNLRRLAAFDRKADRRGE